MELEFKFTKEEAQVILNALVKEPFGVVSAVINKLQEQAATQINEKEVKDK